MIVTLFSTHCPKCRVLETKLKQKNIEFSTIDNVDEMLSKGIKSAPYLEVDNELMDFNTAVKWVNEQ